MPRQWIAISFGALILILLLTTFGERGLLHIHHLGQEYEALEKEMAAIRKENERLRQEIEALRTNREYIEAIARREFGLVKPNEVIYRFMTSSQGGRGQLIVEPPKKGVKSDPGGVKN